jgi:hypothetical protein
MNKTRITRFIQKYNLAGLVESVAWKAADGKLITRFISDDKTVLGEIHLDNFTFNAPELGVYTTSALNKLLSVALAVFELQPISPTILSIPMTSLLFFIKLIMFPP